MMIQMAMIFALGFLCAATISLLLLPAIWHRAVRLTRRRIADTTPVTLSELRAEKDQLRARNAVELRKLELQLDSLRKKRASQLRELTVFRQAQEQISRERDSAKSSLSRITDRNQELVDQIQQYEIELTGLRQKLRSRERELSQKIDELGHVRTAVELTESDALDDARGEGRAWFATGGTEHNLAVALNAQKRRNAVLEERLRASEIRAQELKSRSRAAPNDTLKNHIPDLLDDAEAHILIAAERFQNLLSDVDEDAGFVRLANQSGAREAIGVRPAYGSQLEDDLEDLGARINTLQEDILNRFERKDGSIDDLRQRLDHVAVDVSHAIYAQASEEAGTESLFDRVRKYSNDGVDASILPTDGAENVSGRIASRMDTMKVMSLNSVKRA